MRRMTTGVNPLRFSGFRILGFLLLCLLPPADAGARDKKGKQTQKPYALVTGTVFQQSGFIVRGAEVTVTPNPERKPAAKVKKAKAFSDSRGEFAVRLPAIPMRYTVKVKAKGFKTQEKSVSISLDERVDLFFRLEPAAK
jgi:hypothetical protein